MSWTRESTRERSAPAIRSAACQTKHVSVAAARTATWLNMTSKSHSLLCARITQVHNEPSTTGGGARRQGGRGSAREREQAGGRGAAHGDSRIGKGRARAAENGGRGGGARAARAAEGGSKLN